MPASTPYITATSCRQIATEALENPKPELDQTKLIETICTCMVAIRMAAMSGLREINIKLPIPEKDHVSEELLKSILVASGFEVLFFAHIPSHDGAGQEPRLELVAKW